MSGDGFKLNQSQRMQLKAFICVLGILLILFLLAGRLINIYLSKESPEEPEKKPPVIQVLHNVWIMEEDEEGILIFRDGERENYPWGIVLASPDLKHSDMKSTNIAGGTEIEESYRPSVAVREQLADVTLTDGGVTEIVLKTDKINGRVLSADAFSVEIEGYGRLPLAENYKGYRLYDSMEMCLPEDIRFGYDFTDFCIENGEICGILMVKEEAMKYIRVLIKTSDYAGLFHEQLIVTGDTGFTVVYGSYENRISEAHQPGEEIIFDSDSPYFEGDRVLIVPDVLTGKVALKNVNRSQGVPQYRGTLELLRTEEGIVVTNQVLLEEYLYSVVPSEMPAKYPSEALKAQAICARTYAYGHMMRAGYAQYGAHVDDSTSYQVYNNIDEQESTTTAAKETYGQLLYTREGELAETYYYSTSCGVGSDAKVWKTEAAPLINYLSAKSLSKSAMEQRLSGEPEAVSTVPDSEEAFADFILSKHEDDYEVDEGWYRWSYQVKEFDPDYMLEILKARYRANEELVLTLEKGEFVSKEIKGLGKVTDIYVEKRGAGGVADELVIKGEKAAYKVISEHNIRYVLNDGESKVKRQNGSEVFSPSLLPSGFFILTTEKENGKVSGYTLTGGGFGHGVGMSQNGAKEMAKSGRTAGEILNFFYDNCSLKCVYED